MQLIKKVCTPLEKMNAMNTKMLQELVVMKQFMKDIFANLETLLSETIKNEKKMNELTEEMKKMSARFDALGETTKDVSMIVDEKNTEYYENEFKKDQVKYIADLVRETYNDVYDTFIERDTSSDCQVYKVCFFEYFCLLGPKLDVRHLLSKHIIEEVEQHLESLNGCRDFTSYVQLILTHDKSALYMVINPINSCYFKKMQLYERPKMNELIDELKKSIFIQVLKKEPVATHKLKPGSNQLHYEAVSAVLPRHGFPDEYRNGYPKIKNYHYAFIKWAKENQLEVYIDEFVDNGVEDVSCGNIISYQVYNYVSAKPER